MRAAWLGLALVGCAGGGGGGGGSGDDPGPPVHLTLSIRVEGSANDDTNVGVFEEHGAQLVTIADALDVAGAKGTFEIGSDYLGGMVAFGPEVMAGLVARGHGTGLTANLPATADEKQVKTGVAGLIVDLDGLGFAARHASGVCTTGDWVGALDEIGIEGVTGVSAWCARSLEPVPEAYAFATACTAASACSQPIPEALDARVVPWQGASGADWLTPADAGPWMIPSEGLVTCLAENAGGASESRCDLANDDVDRWLAQLDAAIALSADDPDGPSRWLALSWSSGPDVDPVAREALLAGTQERVDAGLAVWETVPGLLDTLGG